MAAVPPVAVPAVPADPLDDVRIALSFVIGAANVRNNFITNNGVTCMEDFNLMDPNDAGKIVKNYNTRSTRATQLGHVPTMKLQGFLFWYQGRVKCGYPADVTLLNPAVIIQAGIEFKLAKARESTVVPDTNDPGPIQTGKNWFNWKTKMIMFTELKLGADGVPLSRIIREDKPPGWNIADATSDIERRTYERGQAGLDYEEDNERLYNMLVKWTCDNSTAYAYIKPFENTKDGRGAWMALLGQVEGHAANNKRLVAVTLELSQNFNGGGLCYSGENSRHGWDHYASLLAMAYALMEKLRKGTVTHPATKVQRLLDGIQCQNQLYIELGKNYISTNLMNDYDGAVSHMATQVALAYPAVRSNNRRSRDVKEYNSDRGGRGGRGRGGRGGRYYGRGGRGGGRGRGGRGRGGNRNNINGVDIRDPTRNFTDDEFNRLGHEGRSLVARLRRERNGHGGGGGAGSHENGDQGGGGGNRSINEISTDGNDNASQMTDGTEQNTSQSHQSAQGRGGRAGRGFGRDIGAMQSGPRRNSRETKRARSTPAPLKNDNSVLTSARNELDTRADTICVGHNWQILSPTGQTCDVRGFHEDFESIKDVPIVRAASVYTDDIGRRYLLIINEALHFGSGMDHSLINPNQIRHYGIPVSDNPYDRDKVLGIDHEEVIIPFMTDGSTVYFETRLPTDEELESLSPIELTDGVTEWDPNNVRMNNKRPYGDLQISEVQRENKKRREEIAVEHDTDLCLGSISGTLVPDVLYERMVKMAQSRPKMKAEHTKRADKVATKVGRRAKRVTAVNRHSDITPEHLARTLNIGLDKARKMIHVTTQKGVRTAVKPLNRRYRVDHLDIHSNRLGGKWYIDWIKAKAKSLSQNTGAFVLSNGTFTEVYPAESNKSKNASISLREFCQDVGTPEKMKSDRAPEFCGRSSEFLEIAKKKGIDLTYAEPQRKNQIHPIDLEIRELKKRVQHKMMEKAVPERLWDHALLHAAKIRQFLPRDQLKGRTAIETVTGKTPDISEYCDFDFYDLVWYHPGAHPSISDTNKALGRWLGVSHRIGSDLCYWILTVNGDIVAETTVQHVTVDDTLDPDLKEKIKKFTEDLNERLNSENFRLDTSNIGGINFFDDFDFGNDMPQWDPAYGDNTPTDDEYGEMMQTKPVNEADDTNHEPEVELLETYIGARITLDEGSNNGGNIATVKRRATDERGRPIGVAHSNPLLDTRQYEVELESGEMEKLFANQIASNLYSQLDDEGREILAFSDIIDHKKDDSALTKDNGFVEISGGHKKPKKTTRGWKVLVEWKDSTSTWLDLKDVKEANPIELADYAVANRIDDEPAFAWWVPYTFRKIDRIIKKIKTKYWRTSHKYGVRVPKSPEEALKLDAEMLRSGGQAFWEKAMQKEMAKAKVAYEEVEGVTPEQIRRNEVENMKGYQEITCHMIFDVKMDFTRKARYVANGAMTEAPVGLCYSSVVSRDSVRIAFLVAALNGLDILACDIGNAYLNAPCREKIWFVAGLECGVSMKGKPCRLVRALYGLKSSGASWRKMFKDFIEQKLGFKPSRADPDMYYRRNNKSAGSDPDGLSSDPEGMTSDLGANLSSGSPYYELLLVYVDDVLCISHAPEAVMKAIGERFVIKNDEIAPPKTYLGADVEKFQLPDQTYAWSLTCNTYVTNAIETVQQLLREDGRQLKTGKRNHGPLPYGYKPELDTTDECDEEHISRFQQLIGILRWAVELGRIDIQIEVALLSQYQMSPREGHLEGLYLIFHYLWKNPKRRLVMDPKQPHHDEKAFNITADWAEFYGDVREEDPPDMPEPLGVPMDTTVFVDADHASNVVTRRSHSGVMLFAQNALIRSYSKRQNTVESSTFSSELVAMRIARDFTVELRLKLKSIGVPLIGPTNMYCDNQGVVKNTSVPESTLTKKHNSINYHIVRESAAAGILRVGKEDTETNIADCLTKLLPYSRKSDLLFNVLYDY